MATITFDGLDEYMDKLQQMAEHTEGICKAAVYEGAAVVHKAIEAEIDTLPRKTGATADGLKKGLGFAKMKTENGSVNTKIGFSGYNKNGVPNALLARVIVRGTSKQAKNDFVGRAVRRSKDQAAKAMKAKVEEIITKNMK